LYLLTNGPVQVISNGMWAFPGVGVASIFWCANGSQLANADDFSNYISHYPYTTTFNFVNSNQVGIGGGTNLIWTNSVTGISVGISAPNGMIITNFGSGPNVLMTSNINDQMTFVTFGSGFNTFQLQGSSVTGVPGNNIKQINTFVYSLPPGGGFITNNSLITAGAISPIEGIVEGGGAIQQFILVPVNNQRLMVSNFWSAMIPVGSHGQSFTIGSVGVTGSFTVTNNGVATNLSFINGVLTSHSP
jgi:hypothetical protein